MTILIIVVALIGAWVGYIQGAIKQIANLAGIIVGLLLAVTAYDKFGKVLADFTGAEETTADIIAFIAIVILFPIVLGIIASLLTKAIKVIHLSFFNRVAGAVVGAIGYLLILSVAFNVYDFIKSKGGLHTESLSHRDELYYKVKHASQKFIPDLIIVTDSTEEAMGVAPKHSIQDKIDEFGL